MDVGKGLPIMYISMYFVVNLCAVVLQVNINCQTMMDCMTLQ
jgi:hypothetical protein